MKFILGLVVGYAVTILFVPEAGSVTRSRIKERFDSQAREKAREIGARAGEKAYEELKKAI